MENQKPKSKPATSANPKASAELCSKELLGADVVYGKTPKGQDLADILKEMEKMDAIPVTSLAGRKKKLEKLTMMSMDFIGKWGIHPVELMKQCGFIAST